MRSAAPRRRAPSSRTAVGAARTTVNAGGAEAAVTTVSRDKPRARPAAGSGGPFRCAEPSSAAGGRTVGGESAAGRWGRRLGPVGKAPRAGGQDRAGSQARVLAVVGKGAWLRTGLGTAGGQAGRCWRTTAITSRRDSSAEADVMGPIASGADASSQAGSGPNPGQSPLPFGRGRCVTNITGLRARRSQVACWRGCGGRVRGRSGGARSI